ncbi:MAG: Tad domain-containing protein [Actinomycetota bacterium]|nr:Tad domain-containing protein [Actinomycetota bacterium]
MVALSTVVLVSLLAFVTDFGHAYTNKQRMQVGVDAAALAVAQKIALEAPGTSTCAAMTAMEAEMRPVAEAYLADNAPESTMDEFSVSCASQGLVVEVSATQDSPVFFGQVMGVDDIDLAQAAKSVVGPAGSVIGLRPFAICQADADKLKAAPDTVHTISFDNADLGCGYAPGNWGVLDFDGGSNPTGEVAEWIQNGYSGSISAAPPNFIPGNPGAPNPGALDSEMDSILGEEIIVPVFDRLTGTGANSQFRIVGFIGIETCGWKFNNRDGRAPCYVAPSPTPDNYLQVRYKRFIPIGELNLSCPLGTAACDNGLRLFALAE